MAKQDKTDEDPKIQTPPEGPQTVDELRQMYPDLWGELVELEAENIKKRVAALDVANFRKLFPELYDRITAAVAAKRLPAAPGELPRLQRQGRGMVLEIPGSDPFVEGVLRTYQGAGGKMLDLSARPVRLVSEDPVAATALQNYWLRSNGAGDTKRAAIARQALEKFKNT
ncbi:MAG: hypothetical protein ACYTEQ_05635 [Planctomycetota bacterium]|jgi:hypothetical protein